MSSKIHMLGQDPYAGTGKVFVCDFVDADVKLWLKQARRLREVGRLLFKVHGCTRTRHGYRQRMAADPRGRFGPHGDPMSSLGVTTDADVNVDPRDEGVYPFDSHAQLGVGRGNGHLEISSSFDAALRDDDPSTNVFGLSHLRYTGD